MNQDKFLELYSPIVFSSFVNEARFLIDGGGVVLLAKSEIVSISLTKGQNLLDFIGGYIQEISNGSFQYLAKRTGGFNTELKLQHNDGNFYYLNVLFTPLEWNDQLNFLVHVRDETTLKDIQAKQLRQLQRMENEIALRTSEIMHTRDVIENQGGYLHIFLRGLRHDLKSPVTQLKEIIDYYRSTENPKKKNRASGLIDSSLEKLSNTANGFSDFVDMHLLINGKSERCDLNEIIREVALSLQLEIENAGAVISTNTSEIAQIDFNRMELTSIFYNLLSNAIKFRKAEEKLIINIHTELRNGQFSLIVADNGIGIDLVNYSHLLFAPFKRINTEHVGSGIGLSLVFQVLKRNNATIKASSELGKGTSFRIDFLNELN